MRKFSKLAATCAAVGLTALGAAAGTGQVAHAATGQALSSCSLNSSTIISASVSPSCTAGTSTIYNPTGLNITVNPSFFTTLLGNPTISTLLGGVLSATVTYNLTCVVNGAPVASTDTGFTVTSAANNTHAIDLQGAVGSPEPNQCTLANLTVSSTLSAQVLEVLNLVGSFTFGVSGSGDNGIPGAIYSVQGANSAGAVPAICADDTGNGNAGSFIQAFTCESDLADQWLHVSTNQYVHNGDCLNDVSGKAKLSACTANPGSTNSQVWHTTAMGGGYVEMVNSGTGQCLTAGHAINGTTLALASCTGASGQLWKVPATTPV